MNWNNKKVLVTGSAGFIGSNLVESLVAKGAKVTAFVHYNFQNNWGNLERLSKDVKDSIEVFQGDLQDGYSVAKACKGQNIVFHLGALIAIPYSYIAPNSYVNTNITGTLNVMQASLDNNVEKVIHTSTSETYGTAIYTPIDENHPLQGQSPYSASKIGADKIAESYFRSFDLPVATIRPFNCFGPRQSARAVIPTIISQLVKSPKEIKLGSLTPVRDFTFVKDTARGFIKMAESPDAVGKVINVGNGKGITIGELAKMIADLMKKEVTFFADESRVRPYKSEVFTLICDNKKAKEVIDWVPEYSLSQGLQETIKFIEENIEIYKPEIYNV